MGAWIETTIKKSMTDEAIVAPYVGAWIETDGKMPRMNQDQVAPYVGAWIETHLSRRTSHAH